MKRGEQGGRKGEEETRIKVMSRSSLYEDDFSTIKSLLTMVYPYTQIQGGGRGKGNCH